MTHTHSAAPCQPHTRDATGPPRCSERQGARARAQRATHDIGHRCRSTLHRRARVRCVGHASTGRARTHATSRAHVPHVRAGRTPTCRAGTLITYTHSRSAFRHASEPHSPRCLSRENARYTLLAQLSAPEAAAPAATFSPSLALLRTFLMLLRRALAA